MLSSPKLRPYLRWAFLLLGLGLLAYLITKLDPPKLWQYLQSIGPKFIFVLFLNLSCYSLFAEAWALILSTVQYSIPFLKLLKIKISGEAINHLTPFSWGGGDPARVFMLKKHIPGNQSTASVIVDRTLNNFAAGLFMLLGALLILIKFSLPTGLKWALLAGLGVILLNSILLFWRSHTGFFQFLMGLLKTLRIKKNFSQKTISKLIEIDQDISQFYKKNPKHFSLAFALHFLGRLCSVLEIFLIAYLLGANLGWVECYLLASVTVLVNLAFAFVPGSIGVMEGSYAGIFLLLGFDPALGTSIQLVRRIRMLFWTITGFIAMSWK